MSCCPGLQCSSPDLYLADSLSSFKAQLKCHILLNAFPGHPIYSCYITICILYYHHLIFSMCLKKNFFPLSPQLGTGMIRSIQYIGSFLFLKKKKKNPDFVQVSTPSLWSSHGPQEKLTLYPLTSGSDTTWLIKISYTLLVASSEISIWPNSSQGDKRQGRKLWKAPAFFSLQSGMKKQAATPHLWEQALGGSQRGVCRTELESLMT